VTKLTDETLVAYVDGTLDPAERERVEALLQDNPEARDRLEGFRITGRLLTELMDRQMLSPSPKRILDRVLPDETKPGPAVYERCKQQTAGITEKIEAHLLFIPIILITLTAGFGIGWFLNSGGSVVPAAGTDLVKIEENHIRAKALLQDALETLPSNADTTGAVASDNRQNNSGQIKVRLTFRNEERQYCREYEIENAAPVRYSGIACRHDNGKWFIRVQALIAPAYPMQTYVPAGASKKPMDIVALSLMDGAPLTKSEEANAIKDKWPK
jgi:surface antigen